MSVAADWMLTGRTVTAEEADRRGLVSELVDDDQLLGNYQAILEELIRAKPSAAKGRYIRSIVIASSMGPGIKVDPSKTKDLIDEANEEAAAA